MSFHGNISAGESPQVITEFGRVRCLDFKQEIFSLAKCHSIVSHKPINFTIQEGWMEKRSQIIFRLVIISINTCGFEEKDNVYVRT